MDRGGWDKFGEAPRDHAALQPKTRKSDRLWGILKIRLSCRGDEIAAWLRRPSFRCALRITWARTRRFRSTEARKARSVAKIERGPQVARQANSAGDCERNIQRGHRREGLPINQARRRIRHAGQSGCFGRRDPARRKYPLRRGAL